jgi:hypothetical protein
MKRIFDQQNENRSSEPSCPGRRTFVKGIAAMGAGAAAFPLLANKAETPFQAASDNGVPSGSTHAPLAARGVSGEFPAQC